MKKGSDKTKASKKIFFTFLLSFLFIISFISVLNGKGDEPFPTDTFSYGATNSFAYNDVGYVGITYINYTINETSYDDTWINETIYNKGEINDINTSMRNYLLYVNSTNGAGGGGNYDDTWINDTIDNKILTNNNSVVNWINSIFLKISDLVNSVGNWSADKSTYMPYSAWNSTNSSYMEIKNWNATNTSYMIGENFTIQNISMRNYVIDYFGTQNISMNNWISNTYNTTRNNYVLWVNSTNGAGGGGSPAITEFMNTSRTIYESISATGFTTIADLNTSLVLTANNNYSFDCKIIFMSNTTTTGIAINLLTTTTPKFISYSVNIPIGIDGTDSTWLGQGTASNDTIIGTGVEAVSTNYTANIYGVIGINGVKIAVVPTFRSEIIRTRINVQPRSYCRWTLLNG